MSEETLLQFPCQFPIKAMGLSSDTFDLTVIQIVRKHVPDIHEGAVKTRPSKGGKYTSVTVIIEATSKAQLDAIYVDLSSHDEVLMTL